jgi:hypothetical protein
MGGLAHLLAEIRLARPWTTEEKGLADAIAERVRGGIPAQTDCTSGTRAAPAPGVGWMQGAAGIAAFLFRVSRIVRDGQNAGAVPGMDTWWALAPMSNPVKALRGPGPAGLAESSPHPGAVSPVPGGAV